MAKRFLLFLDREVRGLVLILFAIKTLYNKSMKKIRRYIYNKYSIIAVVIIIIVAFFFFKSANKPPNFDYAQAKIGTITEKVSVTGKISSVSKADLSFEKSGIVNKINLAVGQKVSAGETIASLESAGDQAALESAKAELADVSRGLRPEEYAASLSAVETASTSLSNATKDARTSFRDSYVKAQSSIVNYADTFFANPQSSNPTINITVQSQNIGNDLNQSRLIISDVLRKWKTDIDQESLSGFSAKDLLDRAQNYLSTIKVFMSNLSTAVNYLTPGNSSLSQSTINSYVTAMNSGLSTMTQAISATNNASASLQNAEASLSSAQNEFTLKKAGSSAEAIAAAKAKVDQMRAELSKDTLVSPIDGTLTRSEPDLGQFVAAGSVVFSVQSIDDFKIEAYVPEADIAKVSVTNSADITLDAYGSDVHFAATVYAIDPAETVLEGVPTYKVTLKFNDKDSRIRSGMTANIEILTRQKDNALLVPTRAVITENGSRYVRLVSIDGKSYQNTPVNIGLKGSDGFTEIISGISTGDKVVTYVK